MTTEELMRPRYKVIADYPNNEFMVNSIIGFPETSQSGKPIFYWYNDEGTNGLYPSFFDEYPHLFRPLAWWEERKPEDMPEYVKAVFPNATNKVEPAVCKAVFDFSITSKWWMFLKDQIHPYNPSDFVPATESEYLEWLNSNKTK